MLDVAELVAQSIPDVPVGNLVRKKKSAQASEPEPNACVA